MKRSNSGHSDETSQDSTSRATKNVNEREKRLAIEKSRFLADFDPGKSSRERRKLNRRCWLATSNTSVPAKSNSIFDERGRYRNTNADLCDCLEDCPGCHYPCPCCASTKCGPVCRVNRRWAFEMIEHDGKDLVIRNNNGLT